MKDFKFIALLFIAITIQSCFKDDGNPLPTNGVNSFSAKLNNEPFIVEDVRNFKNTSYGISAYKNNKTWLLTFRNSSNKTIYFYLHEIEEVGYYNVGVADDNLSFFDNRDSQTSVLIGNSNLDVTYITKSQGIQEKIKISELRGDNIIIGEFEKITLSNPENPDEKIILTDGKFNIKLETLNNRE